MMKLALILISCVTALSAQTTVTLGGNNYTLRDHPRVWLDGPAGALTTALSDTGSTGRANTNNVVWNSLLTFTGAAKPTSIDPMAYETNAAIRWLADGHAASLANAKAGITNVIPLLLGSTYCDETQVYCGMYLASESLDYPRMQLNQVAMLYSAIRSQLSAGERAAFVGQMLNDNDSSHNGIDSTPCTKQTFSAQAGTISASPSGTTITVGGGGNTSSLLAGQAIYSKVGVKFNFLGSLVSVTDSTHFVIDKSVSIPSALSWGFVAPWTTGNCGAIWYLKHHSASPPIIPGQESHYTTDYAFGGTFVHRSGNLTNTALMGYISLGLALADDDVRSRTLLQQAYDYYYAKMLPTELSSWTGFTPSGAAYTNQRSAWFAAMIAIMIKNSVISGPDLTGTNYINAHSAFYPYVDELTHQDIFSSVWDAGHGQRALWFNMWLYPSDPKTAYANNYLRSVRSASSDLANNHGSYLSWAYVFWDPATPNGALSGAPKQYLFRNTDLSTCQSLGLTCWPNQAYSHVISRTGWAATSTKIIMQSSFNACNGDHEGCGNYGSVHIYKSGYLLASDVKTANENNDKDLTISIGSTSNWGIYDPVTDAPYSVSTVPRWAGTNPTGDSASRFSYALLDVTGAYKATAGVTRAHRHVIHFKETGQDYVVWYDDIAATTAGGPIKAYLHFYHTDCYLLGTCTKGASGITWGGGNDGGTVVDTQATNKLLTTVLSVAGTNTAFLGRDNINGTYTGGAGYTFRAHVCAENPSAPGACDSSATAGEWIVVHQPTTNTSATMPTITRPACVGTDGTCTAVEIQDTNPKVALFARQGQLVSAMNVTTTHAGTAQYVASGVSAGFAIVTRNGAPVSGSPFTVVDGDNTVSFDATAGTFLISSGPALVVAPVSISSACASGSHTALTSNLSIGGAGITLSNWSATKTQSWLALSASSGSAPATITVTMSCIDLPAGTYSDAITVTTSNGVVNNPIVIPVTFSVAPPAPKLGPVVRGRVRGMRVGR